MKDWTFLTTHAAVLLCLARDPGLRLRDLAIQVGITERAAQRVVNALVAEGYLSRARVGTRRVYTVHRERPLRHLLVRHRDVGTLLALLEGDSCP